MKVSVRVRRHDLFMLKERSIERLRGELAHTALSFIKSFDGTDEQIGHAVSSALALAKPPIPLPLEELHDELTKIISKALSLDAARPFYKKGLRVLNEQEIIDPQGAVHRIDRLVLGPAKPVIIEYKLGSRHQDHIRQVLTYRQLVDPLFGESRALLFYLEEPEIVEVSDA